MKSDLRSLSLMRQHALGGVGASAVEVLALIDEVDKLTEALSRHSLAVTDLEDTVLRLRADVARQEAEARGVKPVELPKWMKP